MQWETVTEEALVGFFGWLGWAGDLPAHLEAKIRREGFSRRISLSFARGPYKAASEEGRRQMLAFLKLTGARARELGLPTEATGGCLVVWGLPLPTTKTVQAEGVEALRQKVTELEAALAASAKPEVKPRAAKKAKGADAPEVGL